ncbi:MAG: hypothetical protein FJZ90_11265 [Chloroflexi bacterium]|nr:hypothetical protein [Chloroflexota bacterium]
MAIVIPVLLIFAGCYYVLQSFFGFLPCQIGALATPASVRRFGLLLIALGAAPFVIRLLK